MGIVNYFYVVDRGQKLAETGKILAQLSPQKYLLAPFDASSDTPHLYRRIATLTEMASPSWHLCEDEAAFTQFCGLYGTGA
jgi:hypothetical protein